jgi:hypothetical protein
LDEQTNPQQGFPDPSPTGPPVEPSQPVRHSGGFRGSWAVGLVVIVVGIVFLGRNAGWFGSDWGFDNWWALFILIPAFGSFAGAWRTYAGNGNRLTGDVARTIMSGLALLAVTAIFVLELDWGKVWPVFLVIGGIGLLLGWKRD